MSEEELHKLIKFSTYFSSFLLNFIQYYESDIITEYKYISKIFAKFLEIDTSNNFEKYKIVNSFSSIDFKIATYINSKINEKEFNKLFNEAIIKTIIGIKNIYNKYKFITI